MARKNHYSNYPHGFKHGLVVGELPLTPAYSGQVFWVNNSTVLGGAQRKGGSNGNPGTFVKPFGTIDFAIGQCTANRGDIIYVMENHVEDIAAAAGIDLDVDGVTIVGLGSGDTQAKITFSVTTSTFEVNADNVTISGLWLEATVTGVLKGIDVVNGADDFNISNNRFSAETLGTDEFIDAIFVTTSDRGTIVDNTFDMDEAGADSAIHFSGICLGADMKGNVIKGDYAVACVESVGTAQEQLHFDNETYINGVHANLNTLATVVLLTGTTGTMQNCNHYTNVTGAVTAAVAADGLFHGGNNFVQTSAESAPIPLEGGASTIIRSSVATGKADETDGLALFNVVGQIYVHGITQRAEVVANSAVLVGIQVDATDTTLDSVLVTDTNVSTETTIGDYAVSTAAGGAYTIVLAENTTTSVMWDTPVTVPAGVIEQAASGTPGTLVSGYIIYWSEKTAGATCVAA